LINWKIKIIDTVSNLLRQGLSPKKLSIVISLGVSISIFPILGATTLFCTAISILFKLNLPAIQLANYAAFPLQIILFFPFLKIGEKVSKVSLDPLSQVHLIATFDEGFFQAIIILFDYLMIACLGWVLIIIPIFIILYFPILAILNKYEPILVKLGINK
tara:strand:- start:950 stop:1429 length:480 start_codon:yes stop_codon:yes gene_type:complete